MHDDIGKFPVIETGPFKPRLIEFEPQRFNQMQLGTGVCTKAYDIAGIGRYFGLIKNQAEHRTAIVNPMK